MENQKNMGKSTGINRIGNKINDNQVIDFIY
jgi:ribosome biogenesis GTPase A